MASTTAGPWLTLPDELYQDVRSNLAGRDDNIVRLAVESPASLGCALFNYWGQRKRTYSLHEVLLLLEPQSLEEGAAVNVARDEIEHTLRVQSLLLEWLAWAEADFVVPERFKELFREQFPNAAERWATAFKQDPRGFGHLMRGQAITIRDFREGTDLGYDVSDSRQRHEVLGKLDHLVEVYDEIISERFDRYSEAQRIRPEFESRA